MSIKEKERTGLLEGAVSRLAADAAIPTEVARRPQQTKVEWLTRRATLVLTALSVTARRYELGLAQKDLSILSGISPQQISDVEGAKRFPDWPNYLRLCGSLNVRSLIPEYPAYLSYILTVKNPSDVGYPPDFMPALLWAEWRSRCERAFGRGKFPSTDVEKESIRSDIRRVIETNRAYSGLFSRYATNEEMAKAIVDAELRYGSLLRNSE
jgi:transcriptional regulator with XRE-family HTH domain